MGVIVSIHQPAYLPWLGYFDKIAQADLFVYLDTVQFQKGSFQNRNKIRTQQGWTWLTVPVETKGALYDTALKDVAIKADAPWRKKHLAAIRQSYARAPHFESVMAWLEPFYLREWDRLSDLCFEMMVPMMEAMAIETPVLKASEMATLEASKSDLVLEICKRLGATTYLSGALGRDYLDLAAFDAAGIEVAFQDYAHPVYPQLHGDGDRGFEPYMGAVDFLMCCDEPARLIARDDQRTD